MGGTETGISGGQPIGVVGAHVCTAMTVAEFEGKGISGNPGDYFSSIIPMERLPWEVLRRAW